MSESAETPDERERADLAAIHRASLTMNAQRETVAAWRALLAMNPHVRTPGGEKTRRLWAALDALDAASEWALPADRDEWPAWMRQVADGLPPLESAD